MSYRLLLGDCRESLRSLPAGSIQTCVTSPPYFGLRSYGVGADGGEIGLEQTPEQYVQAMVEVFREVRRVLRDDATLWLNLGDSYSRSPAKGGSGPGGKNIAYSDTYGTAQVSRVGSSDGAVGRGDRPGTRASMGGLDAKQLLGIPWRVAFALQADGWYLRQDLIWCLSGGAWVYARTRKGDMPVMVKDLVRLNPTTVKLWNGEKWTQVIGWGASNDTSEKLQLTLRSGERIGCTGSHLWPTQRGNVAARDLRVGDIINTCQLPEPMQPTRPAYLTDGLLWLIGLYLAEGSRSGDTIQISLHADEKPWLPLIGATAKEIGASLTSGDDGNNLSVRLYGRVLSAVLDDYLSGTTAIDKHLATKTWMLPNNALRLIAKGYLDGDGHEGGRRVRLGFCRNYALERDLRTLAARLGATLTLKPVVAQYQGGRKPAFRGEWRWGRSGHYNEKDRGEVVAVKSGRARQFWDIAVEDEPHLFALSSGVLTHNCKPNPMPESVRDRCTKAHEYIFLLSKSERYYFDSEAMQEPGVYPAGTKGAKGSAARAAVEGVNARPPEYKVYDGMRNKRSVWTVTTKPYKGAHFATFPPDLIEPCVLAGTSALGHCEACGAGWYRITRDEWRPGCGCNVGIMPGTVLDPFGGSGTTAGVAVKHGRNAVLCELNPDYAALVDARVRAITERG